MANPLLGVALHALGGIGHGSFYAPLKKVRGWAWESAWLAQGLAAWLITPWLVAWLTGSQPLATFAQASWHDMRNTFLFGAIWGMGSLTFGLSMRYLGMSLGQAVALGYTVALGTLIPPLLEGKFAAIIATGSGKVVVFGVVVCLLGIGLCGLAGVRRDRERGAQKTSSGRSLLGLGFLVASFSGIMSSGFALGINAGKPLADLALKNGSPSIFQNSPTFILVMAGGLSVNLIWCLYLGIKNRSTGDFLGNISNKHHDWNGAPAMEKHQPGFLKKNYLWASIAGVTWYVGFMLYGMGTTFMGDYHFVSWSIHLAFVIAFSTLCGILAREWSGVRPLTAVCVAVGMAVLVGSTLITASSDALAKKFPSIFTEKSQP